MTTATAQLPPRTTAKIVAYGYLVIFGLAIFANFFVLERLIEPDDASAAAGSIADSQTLFRFALVAFLVVFVIDIVIAWALYIFFRATNAEVSLLAAWFRVTHAILMGAAVVFLFIVAELVGDSDISAAFPGAQLDAQVGLLLEGFTTLWLIGLAAFGIHLALLGFLVAKAAGVPKVLGALLTLAGAVYVIDTVGHGLLANYADYADVFLVIVAVPSVIGELAFAIWLLLKGGKTSAPSALPDERPAVTTWASEGGSPGGSGKPGMSSDQQRAVARLGGHLRRPGRRCGDDRLAPSSRRDPRAQRRPPRASKTATTPCTPPPATDRGRRASLRLALRARLRDARCNCEQGRLSAGGHPADEDAGARKTVRQESHGPRVVPEADVTDPINLVGR